MDGPLADRKRGFLDGLRASRMRMASTGEIFGTATKFHQNRCFMDHFTGLAPDDVHTEHAIRFRICENLHKAVRSLIDLGATVRGKWKLPDGIRLTRLLQFLFVLADRGYLW